MCIIDSMIELVMRYTKKKSTAASDVYKTKDSYGVREWKPAGGSQILREVK